MPRIDIPKIKFVHITQKDWLHFKELDPLDRLDLIFLPGAFAIGAFDMSKEEPLDVGLMVVLRQKDRFVLEWLCVDPEHRNREIGGALLAMLFDMSLEQGFKQVAVRLTSELRMNVNDYLWEHFFEEEEEAPDLFRVSVEDFFKSGKHSKPAASGDYVPVSSLGSNMKDQVTEYISGCSSKFSLYDGDMSFEHIDGEISYVALDENKKVIGALLCMTPGTNCIPVVLAADTPSIEENLINNSAQALHRLEKPGFMLSVFCRSTDMSELADQILGGEGRIHQTLLIAETANYAEML